MNRCPFCGRLTDRQEVEERLAADPDVLGAIRKKHPNWGPQDGICLDCVDDLEGQYQTLRIQGTDATEEPTVVTKPDGSHGAPVGTEGACLITIHGSSLGKQHGLTEQEMSLGRSESAGIHINEENVSRHHARLFRKGNEFFVEDMHSTNGTFVNTRKILNPQSLKDGDLILIGNTILKFVSGSNIEHKYHEELYRLATVDGLTQIFNKAFLMEKLAEEFNRARRYERQMSLIMFDLDHFRNLNNRYGHVAGDYVLRKIASVVLRNMRKEDVFGRYGGEEFLIVLPEIDKEKARILAEKLRRLVEKTSFEHNEIPIQATISSGVSSITKSTKNVKQFLEKADKALYRAKSGGRNQVCT